MADLSIRNLEDSVRERLRNRAASHGRSMESEVRAILTEAVMEPERPAGFLEAVFDRFSSLGGVELDIPERSTPVRGADFSQ
ncbi:MAG TPA: Arc family DNA-binding protein [Acidimicrobiia bacterium]